MDKKKLIVRIAKWVAAALAVVIVIALSSIPVRKQWQEARTDRLKEHINRITEENQTYLNEVAERIKETRKRAQIAGVLESEIQRQHMLTDQYQRYLWFSQVDGEFVFGFPAVTFSKLNALYDRRAEAIKKDGYYQNRNHFLSELIDQHELVGADAATLARWHATRGNGAWWGPEGIKRLDENDVLRRATGAWESWNYVQDRSFLLKAPVIDSTKTLLGEVFLKVDDWPNAEMYFTERVADDRDMYARFWHPFCITLGVPLGLTLLFLLPSWTYLDARQRGVSRAMLWALFSLISIPFGFIIYLIIRPSTLKALHCPQCEKEVNGGAYCPFCGFDMSGTICRACQYPVRPEWSFCPNCRSEIKRPEDLESEVTKEGEVQDTNS